VVSSPDFDERGHTVEAGNGALSFCPIRRYDDELMYETIAIRAAGWSNEIIFNANVKTGRLFFASRATLNRQVGFLMPHSADNEILTEHCRAAKSLLLLLLLLLITRGLSNHCSSYLARRNSTKLK